MTTAEMPAGTGVQTGTPPPGTPGSDAPLTSMYATERLLPPAPQSAARILVVTSACLLLGVALGALWAAWAPRADLTADGSGGFRTSEVQLAPMLTGELVFGAAAVVAGVGVALTLYAWRRAVAPIDVVACAIGGVAGALTASRVGVWLGGQPDLSTDQPAGTVAHLALRVSIGALELAWPIASVVVIFLIALWSDDRARAPAAPVATVPAQSAP